MPDLLRAVIMRLSDKRIKTLQILLKEEFGLDYSDEQAQEAGMAIMRLVVAKNRHKQEMTRKKENENE